MSKAKRFQKRLWATLPDSTRHEVRVFNTRRAAEEDMLALWSSFFVKARVVRVIVTEEKSK